MHRSSLVWVDMPTLDGTCSDKAAELRETAETVCQAASGLLVVSGGGINGSEECWARSIGAWAYLPEVMQERQFQAVLSDATVALERIAGRRGGATDSVP
ncbi:MAG: hypothetical protein KDA44_00970 [Planctomycetales bacterium]|nr:hypothetical protein [Planctomycetales bacterium]